MNRRLNGYTDLPAGTIAAVVTYLEMRERPAVPPPEPAGWSLAPLSDDLDRYRALFGRVGESWLWFSRLVMSDAGLRSILGDPRVKAFALHEDGRALGFYMRSGFRPYKRAVEIADDPRLKGYLPPAAAPHMPPLPSNEVRSR